ncbi:MAG: hypothetical protein WCD69_14865, partial [Xanthobacteraceae bacterium]
MPFGSVKLVPGVNVERTPTLLEAAISQSQLVRFKDALVQKLGGWMRFFQFNVPGIPRDLHAWQDLNQVDHLAVGTTTALGYITSNQYTDITPQTLTTNFAPNFTTTMGSPTVDVTDSNVDNVTIYDSIYFNTPVSVDSIILSGIYPIVEITGADSYDITAATNGVAGVTNGGVVPQFTTVSGSAIVQITFPASTSGLTAAVSDYVFPIATTGNGVTIAGSYVVTAVLDANNFTITVLNQASGSGSFFMNSGNCQLVYYIAIGPPPVGGGYGLGTYGSGGYGTGTGAATTQMGTEITATDWTTDNWGEILLACPHGGGVYQYDPTAGFTNSQLVVTAPLFNGGIFISTTLQILVCWASTNSSNAGGYIQDPMLVRWSTVGDYTNFLVLATDQAGSFRIPIGSMIVGGAAVSNQNLIWTDQDLWAMNYVGPPFVFGFNQIGSGAGAVSSHAMQKLRGNVYWMGPENFFSLTGNGVSVIACPVWDFVFQNINTAFISNVRSMPNTPFNEAGWEFPSAASVSGENDSYVKFNILEPSSPWDYGTLQRSAWIDQNVFGSPISATSAGIIYQHETSPDADGSALVASFTTNYFMIADGEDFTFVDQIYPDMKWGLYPGTGGASIQMTFNVTNYPGDAPVSYGPYTVNQNTEYLSVRFRGRQMSITLQSSDVGSFWRLGRIRYRYAQSGRR